MNPRASFFGWTASLLLVLSPLLLATYVSIAGVAVQGEVTAKRESFSMPGGDRWEHVFEVTFRYPLRGSDQIETASHQVDPSFYGRLQIGSPVQVRYSPSRTLRLFNGIGAELAESSWLSRFPHSSSDMRDFGDIAALAGALMLALLAYLRNSGPLGLVAGLAVATLFSAIVLAGFLIFPILFWCWRRSPGKGYGWILLGSMALSAPLLYWRIPGPAPAPVGPEHQAVATVRQVHVVDHLWSNWKSAGQGLRKPFQMVDLAFTPPGATDPVHVLDRVDLNSVPGLQRGAEVRVSYPVQDARAARIVGATRTYAHDALIYFLELTYLIAAFLAFLVFPTLHFFGKLLRSVSILGLRAPFEAIQQLSRMPADDPRRKALDAFMRARREESPTSSGREPG